MAKRKGGIIYQKACCCNTCLCPLGSRQYVQTHNYPSLISFDQNYNQAPVFLMNTVVHSTALTIIITAMSYAWHVKSMILAKGI